MSDPAKRDSTFAGSIPGLYDQYMGPLLFEPYARIVADRAKALFPSKILETAAGTGIVTAALRRALPDADIVATDLNQAMLDVAVGRLEGVELRQADSLDLPFENGSFDLVVCQFGVMFYPDRGRRNAEAKRVLRDGGNHLVLIWDALERNPVSRQVHDIVAALYSDDPPQFLARTPFGYADEGAIRRDLIDGGFATVEIERVDAKGTLLSARDAAIGLVAGSPLRNEIVARDPAGVDRVVDAVAAALGDVATLDTSMSAFVVTAS